jgi:hypothetical protein
MRAGLCAGLRACVRAQLRSRLCYKKHYFTVPVPMEFFLCNGTGKGIEIKTGVNDWN